MSRTIKLSSVAITLSALAVLLFSIPANAQTALKLLGQLHPFDGSNRYADVWGEGNYAYLGSLMAPA